MPDPIGPSVSTCELFATLEQLKDCCAAAVGDDAPSDADLTLYLQAASDYVSELLAGRFRGVCTTTVRPCPECACGFGATWISTSSSFMWVWPRIGGGGCECGPYPSIDLGPDPVIEDSVVVTYEGVTIDPLTYRVDDFRYLVRLDSADGTNPGWPRLTRPTAHGGQEGELVVTYSHGYEVPPLAMFAARDLACQFVKACPQGGECDLPANVTSLVRQGVSMRLEDLSAALRQGSGVNLPSIQRAVEAYNSHGWRSLPVVDDPDAHAGRHPTP